MIVNKYNNGGGGSISGGSADYATLAGESNKSKLLEGGSALPQSGNTGDVVAVAPTSTKGLRSANTALGIYQYDGSAWNPIGGESSSAYKIELSNYYPEYFTSGDTANLNAFYAALVADPSIGDGAYIKCGDYIFNLVEWGSVSEGFGEFKFAKTDTEGIKELRLHFEDSEYVEGFLWTNNFDGLYTTSEFPELVNAGHIVNFDDGENMGLYVFDGEDWVPYGGGEGGDNTVLKALSGAPATLENGDVFAIHTPSADTQYEVSAWTNTEEYTINFDDYVQAIKVHIKTNGYFDFGFNNPDWHDGFGFTIEADGKYGYVFSTGYYDSSRWEVSEQSIKFIASDWMAKTGGKTLYLDIREDNGDYYLYIYTDDISKIWITDVAQNELEGEVQVGTVIPAHDAYDKTYQASNEEVVELAKVTDLPAENRLVPHFDQHDDSSKVLYIDYWNGPVWQPQTDLVRNVFATYDGLGNHKDSVLIAKDAYHFKWDYIDNIHPITALPAQSQKGIVFTTEDGIFHAGDEELDTTNLYEIENHNDWDNPTGGTHLIISGSASADRVGFKFEGLSDDFMLIWNGTGWDYEWFENVTQENGNFTGYTTGSTPIEVVVSYDATNDVFEIVCGEPWTGVFAGNDWNDFTSQYFVANLPVTKYSKSVTSNSINSIVKLTQAEYDALVSGGTVDANTFYVIISNQS